MAQATTQRAQRFIAAMQRTRPDAERPLPVQLKPLADLVVGPAQAANVRVRTGSATQAALAAAGRPAATVDNVIHLASPPDTSKRSVEVVAHELVHAARPSPVPRFFDDDHDSQEEREAHRTGRRVAALIRAFEARSESARAEHLTMGTAGLAVAPGASPLTAGAVGQLVAGRVAAAVARDRGTTTTGAVSAATAMTSTGPTGATSTGGTGGATPETSHRPRRANGRHRPGYPSTGAPSGLPAEFLADLPPAVARILDAGAPIAPTSPSPDSFYIPGPSATPGPGPGATVSGPPATSQFTGGAMPSTSGLDGDVNTPFVGQATSPISSETLDWIVEAVEERILAELERRGLRFQPGVF